MKVGDFVSKKSGYQFNGFIVSKFVNSKKQIRYVVEHSGSQTSESGGMLHIFNESQLELAPVLRNIKCNDTSNWHNI